MRNVLFLCALAACTSSSSSTSQVTGAATYRDAATDDNGQPKTAAAPSAQHVSAQLEISGTGTIPQVDARCATDPIGQFVASYSSSAQLSNSGAYVAAVGAGTIATPSGCAIGNLTVSAVTSVKLVADLAITTENCQTYCAASARADAEAQCGGSATCRAQMESSLAASCQTTCTTQAHSIRAEADIGVAALGQMTADELRGGTFADLEASLQFSELVDAGGHKL